MSLELTNDLKSVELERKPEFEVQPTTELKQEDLEPLDRTVERTQEERDAVPLAPDLNLTQANEMNTRNDDRLEEINQELQVANDARQIERDRDNIEVANIDRVLSDELTQERNERHDVLSQSSEQQLANLEAHPELQRGVELSIDERREISDEELAQLNAELVEITANNTIPSKEITDRDIDELTQTLKEIDNEDKSLFTDIIETAKTVGAFGEAVAKESVNILTEGLMSAGALGVGAGVAVKELDIDAGINAMRGTLEILKEDQAPHDLKLSEFSKERLANSETLQTITEAVSDHTKRFYDSVGYFGGENAEGIARDALATTGKVASLVGTGVMLNSTTKLTGSILTGALKESPQNIYLKTEHISDIYASSRIWGQTEGSVYGMTTPNAPVWKTNIDPKIIDPGIITLEGQAASLFKPHPIEGVFSGYKRIQGQHKAPFGDIVFTKETATFDNATGNLTIRNAEIGNHVGQSTFEAATRLIQRKTFDWSVNIGIGGVIHMKTKDFDIDLNAKDLKNE